MTDRRFLTGSLIIGLSTLALGGFFAGRIAKRDYLLHGALVGSIALLIGLLISAPGYPTWFTVAGFVLDIPAAVLGAMFAKPRIRGAGVDAQGAA